jgi:hypothetical protein
VDVGVAHGLTRGGAVVDPDVEAVGFVLGDEFAAYPSYQSPQVPLLLRPEVEDALDVAPRHDQGVAVAEWESVRQGDGVIGFEDGSTFAGLAERTEAHPSYSDPGG